MYIREPVNSWTHLAAMLAVIPATAMLLRLCRGDRVKFWGMLIYCCTLFLCFAGSGLFHAVPYEYEGAFGLLDHFGIYLLIAGTVTPLATIMLHGWPRLALLTGIWALAATGITVEASLYPGTPLAVRTGLYLGMGWIGCTLYFQMVKRLSHAKVVPMWLGGLFYSVGAAINLKWTQFPPELSLLVNPHAVFHVLVIAGAASHYYFMIAVLIPYRRLPAFPETAEPSAHAASSTRTNAAIHSGSAANVESRR